MRPQHLILLNLYFGQNIAVPNTRIVQTGSIAPGSNFGKLSISMLSPFNSDPVVFDIGLTINLDRTVTFYFGDRQHVVVLNANESDKAVLRCSCEPHPPAVVNDTDRAVIVKEDAEIGTILWTLEARDDDGDDIIIRHPDYETESRHLVIISQTLSQNGVAAADIILNQTLDRDFNPDRRSLLFVIEDQSSNKFQTTVVVDLVITDVNDEAPAFQNLPYRLEIQENESSGQTVYSNIHAYDPDTGIGGKVVYNMEPITQSSQDATAFLDTFSINNRTGAIFLKKSLDYEQIQFYQFRLYAADGFGLQSSEVLTIRILDIQDTPPIIQGGLPYVVTIPENMQIGSYFYTARAMDGDRGIPNDVRFQFSEGVCLSLFAIDSETGEITVAGEVDRDSGDIMENAGMCELTILVSEVNQNEPQYGSTTTTATIKIFVTDENDNIPSINEPFFSTYIDNTAQLNYPIQFENNSEIIIEDKDQGVSGILELVLRDEDGDMTYDFEPIPSVIASKGSAHIALKSPDLLNKREEINLKLYAIERDTEQHHSAMTTIRIKVIPVGTTTTPTTTVTTTTERYMDPFIPSLIGAIIPGILLIWAAIATCYYCVRQQGVPQNNKVFHHDMANGNTLDQMGPDPPPVVKVDRNHASNA